MSVNIDELKITIPKAKPKPIQYSLKIDCRENGIVEWYKKSSLAEDTRVSVERMDTSDFIFLKDDKPFICIERKRIDDFASSIRDGRYKTQKLEMIEYSNQHTPAPFLVYLVEQFSIENDDDAATLIGKTNISKDTILSAITKTMFRDGFQMVFTTDIKDTIRWLIKMWTNLCNAQFEGYDTDESFSAYYQNVSRKLATRTTSQMKDIDRDKTNSWWMLALSNINGISANRSQEIVKKYPTAKSLLDAYDGCNSQKEKQSLVANLKVNTRRIGDAASKAVYEHITNDTSKLGNVGKLQTNDKQKSKNSKKNEKKTKKPKESVDFSVCLLDSDSEGW